MFCFPDTEGIRDAPGLTGKPDYALLASIPEKTFVIPPAIGPSTRPSLQTEPKPHLTTTTPSQLLASYKLTRPRNPQTSTISEYKWLKIVMQISQEWVNEPTPTASARLRTAQTHSCLHPNTHELYNETTIHTILELKTSRKRDILNWSPVLADHLHSPTQSRTESKQIKQTANLARRRDLETKSVFELPTQTHRTHRDYPHHVHNIVMQELLYKHSKDPEVQ